MPFRQLRKLTIFVSTFLCFVVGCSNGGSVGPKTVRVSGVVTLGGKPLEGASVYFSSEKFSSFGKTNAEGRYELIQGAVPGKNKVYISKFELPDGASTDPESGIDVAQFQAAAIGAESSSAVTKSAKLADLVPEEFSDPLKSKLTYDVLETGATNADFRL